MDKLDDAALAAMFDEARAASLIPSEAMLARILADAEAQLPRPAALRPQPVRAAERAGLWGRMLAALGGRGAAAGLAAASFIGLSVGMFAPDTIAAVAQGYSAGTIETFDSTSTVELTPSFYDLLTEG